MPAIRRIIFVGATVCSLLLCHTSLAADQRWGSVKVPTANSASAVYGFYSAGCLSGARVLPLEGEGYQVMRTSRNRFYGHPALIDFVNNLAQQAQAKDVKLLIGDLSQPRGGPMTYGHTSHQIGLDVDVWFTMPPLEQQLSAQETEAWQMASMVDAASGTLRPDRWASAQRDLLKAAAEHPRVQRIFVNPIIKQALCQREQHPGWLQKVRAWWGHDAHFHVRLHCPADSPDCRPQKAVPTGSGCDAGLANWVQEIQEAARRPPTPRAPSARKAVVLPTMCENVLQH